MVCSSDKTAMSLEIRVSYRARSFCLAHLGKYLCWHNVPLVTSHIVHATDWFWCRQDYYRGCQYHFDCLVNPAICLKSYHLWALWRKGSNPNNPKFRPLISLKQWKRIHTFTWTLKAGSSPQIPFSPFSISQMPNIYIIKCLVHTSYENKLYNLVGSPRVTVIPEFCTPRRRNEPV